LDVVLQTKQINNSCKLPQNSGQSILWDSRENLKQDFEGEECLWDSRESPKQDFEGRTWQWVQS
jgi:hypothetical protein